MGEYTGEFTKVAFEAVADCRIYAGDNRVTLPNIGAGSVHCVVTSPPYYAQRDYGGESDQIGREQTPEEYVAQIVKVMDEVRQTMRRDATLWLNLGDKFIDGHLLGMPWRVAFAMKAAGWILRSDIIWHRTNAMPSGQRDRPTCNHEYIFLFAREKNYFYDDVAIREPAAPGAVKFSGNTGPKTSRYNPTDRSDAGNKNHTPTDDRTKRTVWPVPTAIEKEDHFAVFPRNLIMPCILAGTSEFGCCMKCGSPYVRVTERERVPTRPGHDTKVSGDSEKEGNRDPQRHVTEVTTLGWQKNCACDTDKVKPCVVLDPFGGLFTTACAAISRKRRAIVCELNPKYIEIGKRKLMKAFRERSQTGLQSEVLYKPEKPPVKKGFEL